MRLPYNDLLCLFYAAHLGAERKRVLESTTSMPDFYREGGIDFPAI